MVKEVGEDELELGALGGFRDLKESLKAACIYFDLFLVFYAIKCDSNQF